MEFKASVLITIAVLISSYMCDESEVSETPSLVVPKEQPAAEDDVKRKEEQLFTVKKMSYVQFNNPHLLSNRNKGSDAGRRSNRGKDDRNGGAGNYNPDYQQEQLDALYFNGVDTKKLAQRLKMEFHRLSRDELGSKAMQVAYDDLAYETKDVDGASEVDRLAHLLRYKLGNYTHIVTSTKRTIEMLYGVHTKHTIAPRFDCCNLAKRDMRMESIYGCLVSRRRSCDLIPRSLPNKAFNPGRNLTQFFRQHTSYWMLIKWLYFISSEGLHTEFPAHMFKGTADTIDCSRMHQIRHRDIYVRSVMPQPMYVVLVLDHGDMSDTQFQLGKQVAYVLLNSLSEKDRVALVSLAEDVDYPLSPSESRKRAATGLSGGGGGEDGEHCLSHQMFPPTQEAKQLLRRYIHRLRIQRKKTNHSKGLMEAFTLIRNSVDVRANPDIQILIAYISRGYVATVGEKRRLLRNVTELQAQLENKVIINTYMLVSVKNTVLFEKSFMEKLAKRWNIYNDREYYHQKDVRPGQFVSIDRFSNLDLTVGNFFRVFDAASRTTWPGLGLGLDTIVGPQRPPAAPKAASKSSPAAKKSGLQNLLSPVIPSDRPVQYSLPYADLEGQGLVMSISAACHHKSRLIGVFGLDLHFADIVDVITYYKRDRTAYAFLVHADGYTVMHPSLARPINLREMPILTDIRHFEKYRGFEDIRSAMLSRDSGSQSLYVPHDFLHAQQGANASATGQEAWGGRDSVDMATYHWRRIVLTQGRTPFIVVVKTLRHAKTEERQLMDKNPSMKDLHYHRLDIYRKYSACIYLRQLATFEFSTFFLSARSYLKPFDFLAKEEEMHNIHHLVTYLTDTSHMVSTPGIRPEVRSHVAVLQRINKFWMHLNKRSKFRDYIVRRYVATTSGVLRMFPGTLMHKSFDPTTRQWFRKALQYPGHVVFTGPYLDFGGGGYIVTLSTTIFEGRSNGNHSAARDRVVAVMGIDFTFRFLHLYLHNLMPLCSRPNMRCFLMEDQGYLVAHPGFMLARLRGPTESNHVTHREPLVADDILHHTDFVRKTLCNSYNDRTIQRRYTFNTSLDRPLTNRKHGEHCSRYQVLRVPETNLFLGLVNVSARPQCGMRNPFCPCSTVDRNCLNCNRMGQKECECPCECPLRMELCSGHLLREQDQYNPSCPRLADEQNSDPQPQSLYSALGFRTCDSSPTRKCSSRSTKSGCSGVVGCEWCEKAKDGQRPLARPYCAPQDVCFGGVLHAPSPYDQLARHDNGRIAVGMMADGSHSGTASPLEAGPGDNDSGDDATRAGTPVGPVAGGIMGCFIVLALGIYCYRHRALARAGGRHPYHQALPGGGGGSGGGGGFEELLEGEDEPPDDASLALAQFESNPAGISPYRVSTGYRRPPPDSDHGYSTAGALEESERASTAVGEPPSSVAGGVPPHRAGLASRSVVSEPDSAVGSSLVEAPQAGGVVGPAGLCPMAAVDLNGAGPKFAMAVGAAGTTGSCIPHPLMLPNLPEGSTLVSAPATGQAAAEPTNKVVTHVQVHSQPPDECCPGVTGATAVGPATVVPAPAPAAVRGGGPTATC